MGAFYENLQRARSKHARVHWSAFALKVIGFGLPLVAWGLFGLEQLVPFFGVAVLGGFLIVAAYLLELIAGGWPSELKHCPFCQARIYDFGALQITDANPHCPGCGEDLRSQ